MNYIALDPVHTYAERRDVESKVNVEDGRGVSSTKLAGDPDSNKQKQAELDLLMN